MPSSEKTVHLVKLCVGVDDIGDLAQRQARGYKAQNRVFHTTRMVPRRAPDLLDGGSIYWVIKGYIRVRQRIIDIEEFTDEQGIGRCHLHFDLKLVPTRLQARRPFQGWRYLAVEDAPMDVSSATEIDDDMPEEMRQELTELGLI